MKKIVSIVLAIAMLLCAIPLTFASAQDDGVFINADGTLYQVQQGEIIEYVYYFSTGEQICSLDGEFSFDADGLELIYSDNPKYEDWDEESLFPKLYTMIVTHFVGSGHIKYNYSDPKGKSFDKETDKLILAWFKVNAESGTYAITNTLHTVAGANQRKYIYNDVWINQPLRNVGGIPAKTPYDPPTEPPTDPPTEPPTPALTEPPTEAPLKVLTDEATGIRIVTDLDADLVITPVSINDFNYYLYNAASLRLYDISLLKDGAPITLTDEVGVQFPSGICQSVWRFSEGVFTDAQAATVPDDRREVRTATPGLFVTNAQDTIPRAQMYGNVDMDDEISIIDVSWIQRDLADIEHFDADRKKIADVDGDGEETINDGTYIQRWLADLLTNNPMERFGYPRTKTT